MNSCNKPPLRVVVNAERRGDASDSWGHKIVMIRSPWDNGSEQEQFEVLNAIRKIYNPDIHADIRGETGQTPGQIGRSEGFTQLQYQSSESRAVTVIVKPLAGYSQRVPQRDTSIKGGL
jgi:hypothetical protein